MLDFISKVSLFSSIVLGIFLLILSGAPFNIDHFYRKFTSPKQNNLILGTSRAAIGIEPKMLEETLGKTFYNYAFSFYQSSYGPIYFNSIKKKLDTKTRDGIFIITVDPFSISSLTNNPDDSVNFREVGLCLDNTSWVNLNPNILYLINNFKGRYYEIIYKRVKGIHNNVYLTQDGQIRTKIPMDSLSISNRVQIALEEYNNEIMPYIHFSSLRFTYLKKTIEYLNGFGMVYLVRLPVHIKMTELEDKYMPDFDRRILRLEPLTNGYLNLTKMNRTLLFLDNHHLSPESASEVSDTIAKWILSKTDNKRPL